MFTTEELDFLTDLVQDFIYEATDMSLVEERWYQNIVDKLEEMAAQADG